MPPVRGSLNRAAMPTPLARTRPMTALGVLLGLVLVLGGCDQGRIRSAQVLMRMGEVRGARAELEPRARAGFTGPHEILGWLEWGSALHESGGYEASSSAFLRAEAGFDEQDRRPRTSITEEFFVAATNPTMVAYRGSAAERVLAPTYRGLNSLFVGDLEGALSAFNESAIRQEQAVALWRERIDAAASAARDRPVYGGTVDLGRSVEAVSSDPGLASRYESLARFEPYRGFVNPFSELVHAVFRLGAMEDAGDADRAVSLLRSVAGMAPENRFIVETLDDAEAAAGGERAGGVTHVFFATGFGPWRESFRVDLPLFLVNDQVDYVGVSFPQLVFDDRFVGYLMVETPDELVRTETVADMDRMIAVEFREELPVLVTRAVIGAAAKVAASWGLNRATEDDETLNAIVRIAAGLYLLSQNRADTRSWASIPKEFQYARVASPASGRVLVGEAGGPRAEVDVDPGGVTMVFVRSLRPGIPLRVRTVVFGREVVQR